MANAHFTVQEITAEQLTPGGGNDEIYLTWKSKDEVPSLPVNEHTKFWPVDKEYENFSTNGQTIKPGDTIKFPVDLELELLLWEADKPLGEGATDNQLGNYILFPAQNTQKDIVFAGGGGRYKVKGVVIFK
ncbi:hypothetical protein [Nostoc sp.]